MEGAMPNHDLEFLILNYRRLTPAGHALLRERVSEHAKTLRAEFLRGLFNRLISWRRRKAAVAQLRALDDAALKDIGLHRSGIEAAVVSSLSTAGPAQRRAFPEKPHLWLQRTG
jgi:uncharacterized protein YjiS (DUF1127 family)